MRYLLTALICCQLLASAALAQSDSPSPTFRPSAALALLTGQPAQATLLPTARSQSSFLYLPCGWARDDDKDKEKNGDDKEKDKKEEMKKILELVAKGKMTVEEAQEKLAEDKKDDDKKEEDKKRKILPEGWTIHGQTTIIPEFDAGFGAKYSGPNSLSTQAQRDGTITSDLYFGAPLWHGAEFHSDLQLWQGFGLSNTFGLNADPNADAYKSGTPVPRFTFAHFFIRQTIGLGGEQEEVPDGPFTLPGKQDISRLTATVGRMAVGDIFDKNTYDHDPHTQFMNWGGTMLTWDFPSNTIGYTTGIAFELNQPDYAVRYGWFQMPATPNGFTSDDRIFLYPVVEPDDGPTSDGEFWKQWGMILELERRWHIDGHPGAIRFSTFLEEGYWASYKTATRLLLANPPPPNGPQGPETNIPLAAFGFHYKYGVGLNWEQEIAKNVGLFGRLGWNDGQTAAATYNDSNWTIQLGLSFNGARWCRPGDTFGICGQLDGASSAQQAFLKAGGQGISDGDGNLNYGPEMTFETYYDFALSKDCHFALDYQFFNNPSFNRARGPVNVFLARLHWEF